MLLHFHGSDTYRIRQAVADFIARQPQNSILTRIDLLQDGQIDELERQLKYPSFFQEPRIVVARGVLANAEIAQEILDIFEHYNPANDPSIMVIALSQAGARPSGAVMKLSDYLKKYADGQIFETLRGTEQVNWIREFCATRNCSIQATAITLLLKRVPNDTWMLSSELEKLCAYAERGEITTQAILTLVPPIIDRDEFELTDALYAHNKRGIIAALWRRLAEGTAEQLLLGTLASGIRTLLIVQSLFTRGLTPSAIAKSADLHPFVTQKVIRGVSTYTEQQLRQAHQHLAELDRSAKDGRLDIVDGLMEIILTL